MDKLSTLLTDTVNSTRLAVGKVFSLEDFFAAFDERLLFGRLQQIYIQQRLERVGEGRKGGGLFVALTLRAGAWCAGSAGKLPAKSAIEVKPAKSALTGSPIRETPFRDIGELEWSIFRAGDLAEKNERARKKSNQKPSTSFPVPWFLTANHHTQFAVTI